MSFSALEKVLLFGLDDHAVIPLPKGVKACLKAIRIAVDGLKRRSLVYRKKQPGANTLPYTKTLSGTSRNMEIVSAAPSQDMRWTQRQIQLLTKKVYGNSNDTLLLKKVSELHSHLDKYEQSFLGLNTRHEWGEVERLANEISGMVTLARFRAHA